MNVICSAEPCPVILDCSCVHYSGANLIYTGIVTNDNLCSALQKIDAKFQDAGLGYVFNNGLIQSAPGNPVQLGGTLIQNTTIASGGYTLTFTGDIFSNKFVTIGGTSSQFVKGDGSLDSTSYQPAGNYISSLTGDGTATGPGSSVFTLNSVNPNPGTYGSTTQVPVVTVNSKGLVTSIIPTNIALPSDILSFGGDVTGSGVTGSPVTLTLLTVNSNVYGSNTFLKFAVNGKGLVTSAAPVGAGDIFTALGYTPVPDTRTITINGVTQDLSLNRTWTIPVGGGTVSSVGVISGTGISASVTNPTTTPVITITNTAPDQTVVLNSGTGINVTGTYPNFTIAATNSGTVTSVTASTPLASSGGSTPNITIQQASGSQDGYLSSTDWTTFNSKQDAITLTTTGTSGAATFIANTLNIPQYQTALTNPVTGTGTATRVAFWNSSSSISSDADLYWDDSNKRLGIGTATPGHKLEVVNNGVFSRFTEITATNTNAILLGKSTSSYIDMYGSASERKLLIGNGTTGYADLITYSTNTLRISAGGTLPSILSTFTPNFTFSGGTNTHTIVDLYPNISLTGGTNTLRGVYYHPNNTAGTATTEIAWENTQGDIVHGNLAGSGTRVVTADSGGKLGTTSVASLTPGFEMNFLLMGA